MQTYNHRDEDHGKCKIQWNSIKINIDRNQKLKDINTNWRNYII